MLTNSLIISLIVLFLHYTSWKGEINQWIKKVVKPDSGLDKPLYGCPVCMTPWWGSALYWIIYGANLKDWAVTVAAAAGIAVLYVILLDIKDGAIKFGKQFEI